MQPSQIVAALPSPLAANTAYLVARPNGSGYDVTITNADASPVAMPIVLVKGDPGSAETVAAAVAAQQAAEAALTDVTARQDATDAAKTVAVNAAQAAQEQAAGAYESAGVASSAASAAATAAGNVTGAVTAASTAANAATAKADLAHADALATAADRVQTGLDRTAASGSATSAATSATQAAASAGSMVKATKLEAWTGSDDTKYMTALDVARALFGVHGALGLIGGGTLTYTSSGHVSWSSALTAILGHRGTETTNGGGGYANIAMPAAGVSITVFGTASPAVVTASGIPISTMQSLWYDPQISALVIVDYAAGGNICVPPAYILICAQLHYSPVTHVKFTNGVVLAMGQSASVTTISRVKSTCKFQGSNATMLASQNTTSMARTSAGLYVWTIPAGVVMDANAIPALTFLDNTGTAFAWSVITQTTTVVTVQVRNAATGAAADPQYLQISISGN